MQYKVLVELSQAEIKIDWGEGKKGCDETVPVQYEPCLGWPYHCLIHLELRVEERGLTPWVPCL